MAKVLELSKAITATANAWSRVGCPLEGPVGWLYQALTQNVNETKYSRLILKKASRQLNLDWETQNLSMWLQVRFGIL